MVSIFKYLLQCARRDKIFITVLIAIFVSFFICTFLGSTAAYEKEQMQIVYCAGIFRLILVYGFAVFNAFFISKMLQSKEIEAFLAGPVSRKSLILALVCVNMLLVFVLSVISTILLKCFFWNIIPSYNALLWCGSIFLEVVLISSIAIFFALMLSSVTAVIFLVTIFYITARIMGFILTAITITFHEFSFMGIIKTLVIPLSVFFPRLDLSSQSIWLIYENSLSNIPLIFAQGVIYITLITVACIVDFNKKPL